jgi:hypothetical protein
MSGRENTVRQNTLLMLRRRGYDTSVTESTDTYLRISDALVVFVVDEKVTINHMKNILTLRIDDEKIFIIHGKTITSESKNIIASTKNIETFTYEEMGFDILKVVPPHSKVEGAKHKDWKKFPILKSSDAACRYFGFLKGDIVKIEDGDETIYRRVL